MTSDLFPAYELKGSQELAGVLVPQTNRVPGQSGGGRERRLAHTAAHELVGILILKRMTNMNCSLTGVYFSFQH